MADIVSPSVRSRMMASIKGRDTQPEMLVRRYLHRRGFRFRLAKKGLPGKPDLVLHRYKAVVLVHGCYWHGHLGCRFATQSATRPEFWQAKISGNRERDTRVVSQLRQLGWRVAVVWECALRSDSGKCLEQLEAFLCSDQAEIEISSLAQEQRKE